MTEPNENWPEELASLSFEDAYRRLEETVGQLEQGELPLTEAESLYHQGMDLANRCQLLLTEAELRISQVGTERGVTGASAGGDFRSDDDRPSQNDLPPQDEWDMPPPPEPDDPSLFEDDQAPF